MIEVRNLTKKYGERLAIDHLNFKVKKGEIVGFLGPNGAGKTTTMKIITGFMSPTSGSVKVDGLDVFEHPIEVKKKIGYLPEIPPVYGDMYVKDYLKYVACLKRVPSPLKRKALQSAIQKTGLEDVENRLIQNLSKGYKQRVGLAQAIISEPKVLILDEPTVGLDPRQVAEIRKLIQSLRGDHTLILSTHVLSEVKVTCEKIIILHEGKIAMEDSLSNLAENYFKKMVEKKHQMVSLRIKREMNKFLSSLKSLPGVLSVKKGLEENLIEMETDSGSDVLELISSHIVSNKGGLLELKASGLDLEDLFIDLTSRSNASDK